MSKLVEKVKSTDETHDTTMAFKINKKKKDKAVNFLVANGFSTGKVLREGFNMIIRQLKIDLDNNSETPFIKMKPMILFFKDSGEKTLYSVTGSFYANNELWICYEKEENDPHSLCLKDFMYEFSFEEK